MAVADHLPSEDLLAEQAYLVARGVRPLSLVGHCPADPMTMLRVATEIERATLSRRGHSGNVSPLLRAICLL